MLEAGTCTGGRTEYTRQARVLPNLPELCRSADPHSGRAPGALPAVWEGSASLLPGLRGLGANPSACLQGGRLQEAEGVEAPAQGRLQPRLLSSRSPIAAPAQRLRPERCVTENNPSGPDSSVIPNPL